MMRPVLFDFEHSSAARRVRIALSLKNVDHDTRQIHLPSGGQTDKNFRDVNPQGKVPVLRIDGLTLIQSNAIIEYLEETRPDPALLPPDPPGRARIRGLAAAVGADIHAVVMQSVARQATDGTASGMQAWMHSHISHGFDAIEILLGGPDTGQFCHGDGPTMADLFLYPQVLNARKAGLDTGRWEQIDRISRNCARLPSFSA